MDFSKQHKVIRINSDKDYFGIAFPKRIGEKYLNSYFKVTYEDNGVIVLQSGAKVTTR